MKECDLVMRGGITSGIVYPKALITLSKEYKFRQIGGASAGALAAAFAAAAEANRDGGGFERLNGIVQEFRKDGVAKLFQAHPTHRKLFKRMDTLMKKEKKPGLWFVVRNIFPIWKTICTIDETHYGICPGTSTEKDGPLALTDWMNRRLEYLAGRMDSLDGELPQEPLSFKHLKEKQVSLRLITTNISQQIPANMPIGAGYKLKKTDLSWMLPDNIRQWLLARPLVQLKGEAALDQDFVNVPHGDDMPVLLAVRMSISFPLLFMAIPAYSIDQSINIRTASCAAEKSTVKLNYFLDGGLSSNFPIHYFDAVLPTRPTFGINLSQYHPCRSGEDDAEGKNRISMSASPSEDVTYGINPIAGVLSYLMALFCSAKDWQDSVQMRLPGYRERIVHIALKSREGGMNLHMRPDVIARLLDLGELAGKRILEGHGAGRPAFDFDSHRWRRLLSASSALEKAVKNFAEAYDHPGAPGNGAAGSVRDMLNRLEHDFNASAFQALGYAPPTSNEITRLKDRCEGFITLAQWCEQHNTQGDWTFPSPKAEAKMRSEEFLSEVPTLHEEVRH